MVGLRWSLLACLLLVAVPFTGRAQNPSAPLERIAFGSCAQQDRPQPIWEAVVAARPQLFLFIGDIVYGDTKDMDVLRAKYNKLAAITGYQKLLQTCPVLCTWDDHDFGADDAGVDYPKKAESQQILLDFAGEPKDSALRKQEGIYQVKVFGPPGKRTQILLLDLRYFRSPLVKRPGTPRGVGPYVPVTDPKATMLGEAQWKWLEEQLRQPAELRILTSSIQVVAEDHGWEKWMNIPHERERLYKLLRDTKAGGVVAISGDRHLAELSVMDAGLGYPLYDLTSSGLNQGNKSWRPQEVNRHRVATMNYGNNFGLILVDWEQKDPPIKLQIRDEDGDVILQQKVRLSWLQPGFRKSREVVSAVPKLVGGEPLTAAEIGKRLNQDVSIEMKVQATGQSGSGLVFLNSAPDRRDPDNFTVVLSKAAADQLRKDGVADARKHFEDKTVRVKGKLSKFRDQAQIVLDDPKQIEVVPD